MNRLYKLLDDCHTALAKSNMDTEKYNELSGRLIDEKQLIIKSKQQEIEYLTNFLMEYLEVGGDEIVHDFVEEYVERKSEETY